MDWTAIANDMRKIRAENEVSVAIRRGATTLTAQAMRIELAGGRSFSLMSDAARQAKTAMFILGEPDMNIEIDDRLNYQGILLQVVFIQPERHAFTIAEAIAVK